MSAEIVPITGEHQSPQSMLAEIMSDEDLKGFTIVAFLKDGTPVTACYDVTMAEMSYAIMLQHKELLLATADVDGP